MKCQEVTNRMEDDLWNIQPESEAFFLVKLESGWYPYHAYKAYSVLVISYVFGLIGNVTYLEALASQLDTNINNIEFFVHGKLI